MGIVLRSFQDTYAHPIPNFGIPSPVSGSDQVSKVTNQTSALLQTVDDRLNTSLTSNYPKLAETLAQLGTLANFVVSIDTVVVVPLLTLTSDVSGDVRGQFAPVLAGIDSTRAYMEQRLPTELDRLQALISASVPNRLKDAFGCVRSGLDRVGGNLDVLRKALLAAVMEFGSVDVPPGVLSKHLPLGTVLDVARAVSDVKVCVPSLMETIDSTIANLKTADDYILSLRAMLTKIKFTVKM
uniref:Uncharacterized protein n=1 Tax=Anopheles atroparvus TaxID=41427 RepID=A0A182JLK7_ANOAO